MLEVESDKMISFPLNTACAFLNSLLMPAISKPVYVVPVDM